MIRINLLPVKAAQKKERLHGQLIILVGSTVLVLLACAGVYAAILTKISDVKDEIARKDAEINQLRRTIGEVGQVKKLQEELRAKLDILGKLKDGKTGPVMMLDALVDSLPEKLWLTSFKEAAGALSVSGMALNEAAVAQFMQNLERSPYFTGVELQVIEQTGQAGQRLHKFDISCRSVTPPKGAGK